AGLAMSLTWCRVGWSAATAARSATVLPAPTSPVTTPSADSTTQKLIRAIASACAWRGNRSRAGMDLPNGCGPGRNARPMARRSPLLLLLLARAQLPAQCPASLALREIGCATSNWHAVDKEALPPASERLVLH